MQLRDLIHILWLGIVGCFKFFFLGLCFPFVLLKAIREVYGTPRSKEKLPAQINVSDPAVIKAQRIIEKHLSKKKRKRRKRHG